MKLSVQFWFFAVYSMPLKELLAKKIRISLLSSITLLDYYITVKGELNNKQKETLEKNIKQENVTKDIIEQATKSKVWIEKREGLQNT